MMRYDVMCTMSKTHAALLESSSMFCIDHAVRGAEVGRTAGGGGGNDGGGSGGRPS